MKKNKKSRIVWAVLSVIALLIVTVIIWVIIALINKPAYCQPSTKDWKTGDIFFSVGDSWKSVAVRSLSGIKGFALSDSTPSHCGIILKSEEGFLLVHESTSDRHIVAESIDEYFKCSGAYCIYALPVPYSVDSLKLENDVDSLLRLDVPFDFDFDHSNDSALYCTEMVVSLLEKNGIGEISELRKRRYMYPQDLKDFCKKMK